MHFLGYFHLFSSNCRSWLNCFLQVTGDHIAVFLGLLVLPLDSRSRAWTTDHSAFAYVLFSLSDQLSTLNLSYLVSSWMGLRAFMILLPSFLTLLTSTNVWVKWRGLCTSGWRPHKEVILWCLWFLESWGSNELARRDKIFNRAFQIEENPEVALVCT